MTGDKRSEKAASDAFQAEAARQIAETAKKVSQAIQALKFQAADHATARQIVTHGAAGPLISQKDLRKLGEFLGDWLKRRYSALRVFARIKVWFFASLLTFLGLGFTLRASALSASPIGATGIEFVLSSPSPELAYSSVGSLVFLVLANLYSQWVTKKEEKRLLDIANDPNTHPDVRKAILKKQFG